MSQFIFWLLCFFTVLLYISFIPNFSLSALKTTTLTAVSESIVFHPLPDCVDRVFNSTKILKSFQSGAAQDMHVFYNYFLHKSPPFKGFYVDLAAAWPQILSNTYFFDKCLGWQGICIEAHPERAKLLRQNRSCFVEELAVTEKDGDSVQFESSQTFETGSNKVGTGEKLITVKTATLASILRKYDVKHVDYLSLDLEGSEEIALASVNWTEATVDVMTVESNTPTLLATVQEKLKYRHHEKTLSCGKNCTWGDSVFVRPEVEFNFVEIHPTSWKDTHSRSNVTNDLISKLRAFINP